jgi:hypothetical protein
MKFQNYVVEEQKGLAYYIPKIQKECKPFLKQIKGAAGTLTRHQKAIGPVFKKTTRKNRRPLDTPLKFHTLLDNWFKENFGWKARSSGLFCWGTPFPLLASGWMVFPAGNFKYVWSSKIKDLYQYFMMEIDKGDILTEYEDVFDDFIDKFANTYIDKNLKKAVVSRKEIMIDCNYSYLIRQELIEPVNEMLGLNWQNAKFIGRKI